MSSALYIYFQLYKGHGSRTYMIDNLNTLIYLLWCGCKYFLNDTSSLKGLFSVMYVADGSNEVIQFWILLL